MSPSAIEPQAIADTQAATFVDRLSVNGVETRRLKAPRIGGGVAAYASSDMFKSPGYGKPKAKRWDHRLNEESRSRKLSPLKEAAKYLSTPGLISLGGGLPSSEYFPFEWLDMKVPVPPHFSESATKEFGTVKRIGKHDIADGKSIYDLHVALNYGHATGSAQLLRFITEHTEIVNHPPYEDWQCTMTVGNTPGLEIALRMLTTRGECILTENYTFCSALEAASPLGLKSVGIPMDSEGIIADALDSILDNWDPSAHRMASKPWLLYTIPTGQNPTGSTQSEERRHEIYKVAQKHDLYIIEDEPYYFLQMQPYTGPSSPDVPPPSSHEDFLRQLVPSYLSMDTDGRVMRLDSFSKVIAPGTRTGWITASEQIVERFVRHSEVAIQNPGGISQLVLFKLLDETWGHAGYLEWLINLRMEYTGRRNTICEACERWLPREVTEWSPPMAGMFPGTALDTAKGIENNNRHQTMSRTFSIKCSQDYPTTEEPSASIFYSSMNALEASTVGKIVLHGLWIRILWHKHPAASTKTALELEDDIFRAGIDRGVLIAKGSWSRAEPDAEPSPDDDMFFRLTFAAAGSEAIEEAIQRAAETLRMMFGLDGGAGEEEVEQGAKAVQNGRK